MCLLSKNSGNVQLLVPTVLSRHIRDRFFYRLKLPCHLEITCKYRTTFKLMAVKMLHRRKSRWLTSRDNSFWIRCDQCPLTVGNPSFAGPSYMLALHLTLAVLKQQVDSNPLQQCYARATKSSLCNFLHTHLYLILSPLDKINYN
jgi:hypothetical protein